jgi:hypothetical protein
MSTALFELAISLPERVRELDSLVCHARDCEQTNEELYNSLCRATSVLLAAHLEGYLKELTSAILTDLNYNLLAFGNMPAAIQRSFCERLAYYEGVPRPEIDERIKQLVAFFGQNSVTIDFKAISYKENPNRNPSINFIDNAFAKLGVPDIVGAISGGKLDAVFDNDRQTNYLLKRSLLRFRATLFKFPYRPLPADYTFRFRAGKARDRVGEQSLWHAFIEEVLARRHKVAHGDTLANETTWETLQVDIAKLEVLLQGLTYAAAAYLVVGATKRGQKIR